MVPIMNAHYGEESTCSFKLLTMSHEHSLHKTALMKCQKMPHTDL